MFSILFTIDCWANFYFQKARYVFKSNDVSLLIDLTLPIYFNIKKKPQNQDNMYSHHYVNWSIISLHQYCEALISIIMKHATPTVMGPLA